MKAFFFLLLIITSTAFSQIPHKYISSMKWRMIGPHRGGRTVGAVGVPSQPNVFYIGVNNGGVWKTTDYGRTWFPIFDDQPTGSIGDVVVAPSNPNVVYVGSGEGLQRPDLSVGDGMYKSTDAGKTWTHLGLNAVQQIGGLAIDPKNENRVFVAALGHPYGPNPERGIYRTTNGGKTWDKVFYIDENTGAIQVTIDPKNADIIYADMWAARQGPWENGAWNGSESGLFKSTDGGNTWKKLTNGLPTTQQGLGRIGFCIAPSDPNRLYATVDAGKLGGIYRSDDAGETWRRMSDDERYWGRGSDFAEVKVDPKNPDIVYSANVVTWKSTDGGKTFTAFRGAPGGDDYHRIWINPDNSDIILLATDQGAIITVNGGETFSSWYNQPTAQFYHVSTDNAFPYNVYSGQQESGSVCISSRGNDGMITFRDWQPVGAQEYGYVAADPKDHNIVYGGKLSRYDKRTGQTENISPEVGSNNYRFIRTAPVLFSPVDNRTLYYAGNVLFKTLDGGKHWDVISPDLSRETWEIPPNVGDYTNKEMRTMARRGVIYTVAPSPLNINVIWAGTDDGLIHVTKDGGKTWKNVTTASITSWSKVSLMDAGHFDQNTAYAAVNRIRCDDMRPHIYRTHDGGITWKEIVNGLPNDPINVVREDPVRKGLLYAGSERAVYVSFDDGENWQSLRLNMPATSIRDLVVKDDDLVIGTHGRSFWILDNVTPLRQVSKSMLTAGNVLFKPQDSYRVRWSMYTDTPYPQEEPAGENPPDGQMIDYYLEGDKQDVSVQILDIKGTVVATFTNKDTAFYIPPNNVPSYWVRPQQFLSGKAGMHRFVWDMRYDRLNLPVNFPIGAVYKNTAPNETAPFVNPGKYLARLKVDGKTYEWSFVIKMDPRVKTSAADLLKQHDLSLAAYKGRKEVLRLLTELTTIKAVASGDCLGEFNYLETSPVGSKEPSFNSVLRSFTSAFNVIQGADVGPTSQAEAAVRKTEKDLGVLKERFRELRSKCGL